MLGPTLVYISLRQSRHDGRAAFYFVTNSNGNLGVNGQINLGPRPEPDHSKAVPFFERITKTRPRDDAARNGAGDLFHHDGALGTVKGPEHRFVFKRGIRQARMNEEGGRCAEIRAPDGG